MVPVGLHGRRPGQKTRRYCPAVVDAIKASPGHLYLSLSAIVATGSVHCNSISIVRLSSILCVRNTIWYTKAAVTEMPFPSHTYGIAESTRRTALVWQSPGL